jgi:hypothetical protein
LSFVLKGRSPRGYERVGQGFRLSLLRPGLVRPIPSPKLLEKP